MKKLVLAIAALAAVSAGDVFARCCPKEHCEKPVHTSNCAPEPKCIKRCVVERCVKPRKVCHTECHWECPPCDEVIEGGAEAKSGKRSHRSSKHMKYEVSE